MQFVGSCFLKLHQEGGVGLLALPHFLFLTSGGQRPQPGAPSVSHGEEAYHGRLMCSVIPGDGLSWWITLAEVSRRERCHFMFYSPLFPVAFVTITSWYCKWMCSNSQFPFNNSCPWWICSCRCKPGAEEAVKLLLIPSFFHICSSILIRPDPPEEGSKWIWMLLMTHKVRAKLNRRQLWGASTASEGHSTPLPWQHRPPSEKLSVFSV